MATSPFQQLFGSLPDGDALQRQRLEEAQLASKELANPTQQFGAALGQIGINLFRKFKSGDKGSGPISRLRSGSTLSPRETRANTQRDAIALAAGGITPRDGEAPEDVEVRRSQAVYEAALGLDSGDIDPEVLAATADYQLRAKQDAEQARFVRARNENTLEMQDVQITNQRDAMERNRMETDYNILYDPDTGEFHDVFDARDPEGNAQIAAAVEDKGLVPLDAETVYTQMQRQQQLSYARIQGDKVANRAVTLNIENQATSVDRAAQLTRAIADRGDELAGFSDLNSAGKAIQGWLSEAAINILSTADVVKDGFMQLTTGEVVNPQSFINSAMNDESSPLFNTWRQAGMDRAVFRSYIEDLGYVIATGREGGRLTEQDVARAMKMVASTISDPYAMTAVIRETFLPKSAMLHDIADSKRQQQALDAGTTPDNVMTFRAAQTLLRGKEQSLEAELGRLAIPRFAQDNDLSDSPSPNPRPIPGAFQLPEGVSIRRVE